jgi:hypothetical protein
MALKQKMFLKDQSPFSLGLCCKLFKLLMYYYVCIQLPLTYSNICEPRQQPTLCVETRRGMDKLKLTGLNLGRVFISRSGRMQALQLLYIIAVRSNLELKTRPKQHLGSLLLEIALPGRGSTRVGLLWATLLR